MNFYIATGIVISIIGLLIWWEKRTERRRALERELALKLEQTASS